MLSFSRGSVPEALRASISLPGVFAVVKRGGRFLVDGGLTNPVPVSLARQMGANFIIAVNVIPDAAERDSSPADGEKKRRGRAPNIIQVMIQSIFITTYSLVRSSLAEADVVIQPKVAHIGAGEFHRAQECIRLGELAAKAAVPEIKARLKAPGS
jgi:NTE family protein